jgi:hypothetical protein
MAVIPRICFFFTFLSLIQKAIPNMIRILATNRTTLIVAMGMITVRETGETSVKKLQSIHK